MTISTGSCVLPGCEAPGGTKGYCNKHYLRLYRHGSPTGGGAERGRGEAHLLHRIATEVEHTASGCRLWLGSTTKAGYANARIGGRYVLIHRWLHEHHVGPIPTGMTIDHRCHNEDPDCPGGTTCSHRRCINPDHHEVVSQGINILRARRRKNVTTP